MKKNINVVLILFVLITTTTIKAQAVVWDIASMEVLIANHKAQHESFKTMKNNEGVIADIQNQISKKMVQIEYIENKLYESLKDVKLIVKAGHDIIYAKEIAQDIGKYQIEMVNLAKGDPKLLLISAKTQNVLIDRTKNLLNYIYKIVILGGTDVNLMNNKQRLELLGHVIDELRVMRGMAYSVCRQMKYAQTGNFIQHLVPEQFRYVKKTKTIIDEILRDTKL